MRHVTSNSSGEKSLFNLKVSSYNSDNYGVTNSVLFSRDDPNGSLFRNFRFLVITSHADYFFGSPPSVSLPFFGDNQRSWKINSAPSLRQARVHFSSVPMVTKSQNLPLERSTIRKVKQKIKEDFGISVISRTKRRNSTEQQLKEISDVMAQIHELTLDHELLRAERIDYTFRRNLSAGFLILLVFQLCLCFIYGEGKQFFGVLTDLVLLSGSLLMTDRAAYSYGYQLLMAYLAIKK